MKGCRMTCENGRDEGEHDRRDRGRPEEIHPCDVVGGDACRGAPGRDGNAGGGEQRWLAGQPSRRRARRRSRLFAGRSHGGLPSFLERMRSWRRRSFDQHDRIGTKLQRSKGDSADLRRSPFDFSTDRDCGKPRPAAGVNDRATSRGGVRRCPTHRRSRSPGQRREVPRESHRPRQRRQAPPRRSGEACRGRRRARRRAGATS